MPLIMKDLALDLTDVFPCFTLLLTVPYARHSKLRLTRSLRSHASG